MARSLSELEAKKLLQKYDIPIVREKQAESAEDAVAVAEEIGFPVFLKVNSTEVQHKTDIGAVKEADDADSVRRAYETVIANAKKHHPEADIEGVLVEEKAHGVELIVGVNKDPTFGHVIAFGLGGIFVEVLRDVHFRALPITEKDAMELMDEMRSKKILEGVRGMPPVDKEKVGEVLRNVARLAADHPDLKELDINPLFANHDTVIAVDALMEFE